MKPTKCVVAGIVILGCFGTGATDLAAGKPPRPPTDQIPPDPVADLVATSTEPYAAELSFTATGDDGSSGQAAQYDMRYATAPITESTWDSAHRASYEPLPQPAGTPETLRIEGLDSVTTYFFALKVADEAGNLSGLSNIPSATTAEAPPSAWTTEVLPTTGGDSRALDFHDGPGPFTAGCAISEANGIVALLWDGAQWVRETVDPTPDCAAVDFAFAFNGSPTVSYGCRTTTKFAWRTENPTWNVDSIQKGPTESDTVLEYDPSNGEPTVAYRDRFGSLRFARKIGGLTNGSWQTETVATNAGRYNGMVYDLDGRPVIAYSVDDPQALKVATKAGGVWEIVTLHEGSLNCGVWASIAVDELGKMLAAERAAGPIWVFRKPAAGLWSAGEEVVTGLNGRQLDAAFDGAGTPYLSFVVNGQTFVAFDDGTGWQAERVADDYDDLRTDIRRDPQGGLGVLYGRWEGGVGLARKPAPY